MRNVVAITPCDQHVNLPFSNQIQGYQYDLAASPEHSQHQLQQLLLPFAEPAWCETFVRAEGEVWRNGKRRGKYTAALVFHITNIFQAYTEVLQKRTVVLPAPRPSLLQTSPAPTHQRQCPRLSWGCSVLYNPQGLSVNNLFQLLGFCSLLWPVSLHFKCFGTGIASKS